MVFFGEPRNSWTEGVLAAGRGFVSMRDSVYYTATLVLIGDEAAPIDLIDGELLMEFDIRVQPKAGRNSVEIDGDKVTARVTAAPEGGKANDAVVALLAKRLKVAKRRVHIVRGHKARDKRLRIEDMTAGEVFARLSESK